MSVEYIYSYIVYIVITGDSNLDYTKQSGAVTGHKRLLKLQSETGNHHTNHKNTKPVNHFRVWARYFQLGPLGPNLKFLGFS